ncbi:MAG: hypothetical protein V1818_01960, partial [Candidatus Aenigmatarchaeota archaeon]
NKADIGPPSRCEAADSNSCKDPNTADCAPQANDAVQYTCDTCKYISSSSCTGTTLGGCTNYPSTTVCDQKDCDYLDACHGVTWYEYDDCTFYCDSGSCPNCQCGGETSVCDCHLQTPDCSQAGNWDGDSIACNCNCDDYDIEETVTNGNTCGDGKDNDCDGLIDTREPDCPETSMNFTGTLTYSTGLPVKNSLIEVVIRNTALGFEKKGHNLSDGNGVFFVRLQSLSYQMMTSDFDLAIYVAGEIEAIYECHYSSATDQCR